MLDSEGFIKNFRHNREAIAMFVTPNFR